MTPWIGFNTKKTFKLKKKKPKEEMEKEEEIIMVCYLLVSSTKS